MWKFSNFEEIPGGLGWEGSIYSTLEAAYQASKTDDLEWKARIRDASKPAEAKSLGRQAPVRSTWDAEKIDVMRELLKIKFASEPFRTRLLDHKGEIIEYTRWRKCDTFWGKCLCPSHRGWGMNHLGRLLEEIRSELRAQAASH